MWIILHSTKNKIAIRSRRSVSKINHPSHASTTNFTLYNPVSPRTSHLHLTISIIYTTNLYHILRVPLGSMSPHFGRRESRERVYCKNSTLHIIPSTILANTPSLTSLQISRSNGLNLPTSTLNRRSYFRLKEIYCV